VDLLWSDGTPEAGQHNLRQTVWYIRQHLGDRTVAAQRGTVTLLADVTCDRDAFLAAIENEDLERGVALYSGDFLPAGAGAGASGLEDWAGLERYRLRQLFRRAAELVVRARLLAARFQDAQQLARRVRDADPEEETGWRLLLETLMVAGDRTMAATEADTLEWQLAVRGREPEPSTRELLRRVRRRTVERGTASPPGLPATRLVGRDRQLATILQAWDAVVRGRGSHVDVISLAGFGKTRLLLEVRDRLGSVGATAIYVGASPAAREVSHVFVSEVVTALAGLPGAVGISPAAAETLVALNPSLSSRFPVPGDPAAGEEAIRRRLFALLDLVQAVSDEQPFALLLDDVHWADSGSRQMLEELLSRLEGFRAMMVTAARPGVTTHSTAPTSVSLQLPPLGLDEVRTLVADLGALPEAGWAGNIPGYLRSIAGGSPLVMLDLVERAIDEGVLALGPAGWSCRDPETILADLEALRGTRIQPIESHPRSILVLPFTAPDSEEIQPFSDGLTEDLIAALSRVESLRVVSWPSARKLKGADRDALTLANELNARYVLHGSVGAEASQLQVAGQLTEAVNGTPVWGTSWRGAREQVAAVAPEFAQAIAASLLVKLSPREDRRVRRRAIPDGRAYECYLRAREVMSHDLTGERLQRAKALLRSGLRAGGDNALLYATLGAVYAQYGLLMFENQRSVRRIEACARKALALDSESAEARFLAGLVQCRRGNMKDGVREMLRGLAIDPHHTDALFWCSGWLGSLGKVEIARPLVQRLLDTDPLTSMNLCMPGWVEWLSGRFQAALPWYRRWMEHEPNNPATVHTTAMCLIWNEQFGEARALLNSLVTTAPASPWTWYNAFFSYALNGDRDNALAALTPELAAAARSFEVTCWYMAGFCAMIDAKDQAVEWLEQAAKKGFINYPMLAEYDPFLKRLRGEPRFTRLLDDVKREWESLEL